MNVIEQIEIPQLPKAIEGLARLNQNIAKKPYILGENEKFTSFTRFHAVLRLGVDVIVRGITGRKVKEWDLRNYGVHNWVEFALNFPRIYPIAKEGIQIAGEMAMADRVGNEVRERAFNDKNKPNAWQILQEARENFFNSDHGIDHERRKEWLGELLVHNIDFLRHGVTNIREFLPVLFLESWLHDSDQVITQQRNIIYKTKLNPKDMHQEGGAVNAWLMLSYLIEAGELAPDKAKRIIAATMAVILTHDNPKLLKQRLNSDVLAEDVRDKPKKLFKMWQQGEVNVFSLTLKDVMLILRRGKKTAGFITSLTLNGLAPSVEAEYGYELSQMSQDDSMTLEEMIGFKDEDDQRAFTYVLELAGITDLLDMIEPPREGLTRKLNVHVSRFRPYSRRMRQEEFKQLVTAAEKDIPREKTSDLHRVLWEIYHTHALLSESELGKNEFVQQLFKTIALENFQFLRVVIPTLMVGNYEIIESIFEERKAKLEAKLHRKVAQGEIAGEINHRLEMLEQQKQQLLEILTNKPIGIVSGKYEKRDIQLALKYIDITEKMIGIESDFVPIKLNRPGYDTTMLGRPKVIHAGVLC